jgi:hypothetical protein
MQCTDGHGRLIGTPDETYMSFREAAAAPAIAAAVAAIVQCACAASVAAIVEGVVAVLLLVEPNRSMVEGEIGKPVGEVFGALKSNVYSVI